MTRATPTIPLPVLPAFTSNILDTPQKRIATATLPVTARQEIIRDLVVKSPKFRSIVEHLQAFHMPVDGGVHGRGTVGGILGPSRAGKSWAIKYYVKSLGMLRSSMAIVPRALYIDVPQGMTGAAFAAKAFKDVGLGSMPRRNASWLLDNVVDEIVQHGIELVVIDDAQFMINARSAGTAQVFEGFLIALAEKGTCNVLLSGTEGIEEAVGAVKHLQGRGGFPVHRVTPYEWDGSDGGEFVALMSSIDLRLPFLLPSNLANPSIAAHLYRLSGGVVGLARNVIEDAANRALSERADRIDVKHLRAAAALRRRVGDPYDPFVSLLDPRDPLGTARAAAAAAAAAAAPTLGKGPRKGRSAA